MYKFVLHISFLVFIFYKSRDTSVDSQLNQSQLKFINGPNINIFFEGLSGCFYFFNIIYIFLVLLTFMNTFLVILVIYKGPGDPLDSQSGPFESGFWGPWTLDEKGASRVPSWSKSVNFLRYRFLQTNLNLQPGLRSIQLLVTEKYCFASRCPPKDTNALQVLFPLQILMELLFQ